MMAPAPPARNISTDARWEIILRRIEIEQCRPSRYPRTGGALAGGGGERSGTTPRLQVGSHSFLEGNSDAVSAALQRQGGIGVIQSLGAALATEHLVSLASAPDDSMTAEQRLGCCEFNLKLCRRLHLVDRMLAGRCSGCMMDPSRSDNFKLKAQASWQVPQAASASLPVTRS